MSRFVRRFLIACALLLVVGAALAYFVVPRLIDPERYRGRIESAASDALGRPVSFESLDVSFLPLGLRVERLSVAALPGEPPGEALRADSLSVGARLGALLRGRLEVTSLALDRPIVRVVQDASGGWVLPLPPDDESNDDGETEAIPVNSLAVKEGRLELIDAAGGTLLAIDGLDAQLSGLGSAGSTKINGSGRMLTEPELTVNVRAVLADDATAARDGARISAEIELRGPRDADRIDATLRMVEEGAGRVSIELRPSSVSGMTLIRLVPQLLDPPPLTILSSGTSDLSGRITLPLDEALMQYDLRAKLHEMSVDVGLGRPFDLSAATLDLQPDRMRLTQLTGRFGESDLDGSVSIEPGEIPKLTVDLHSSRLDLDELFASLAPTPSAGAGSTTAPPAAASPLPRVSGTLRVDRGTLDTVSFSEATTTLAVSGQRVQLAPLEMQLYGGSFAGSLGVDISQDPPAIALRGTSRRIDLGAFTAQAFGVPDLLAGTLDAEFDSTMRGLDVGELLASALGKATLNVGDGVVGTLDVIEQLSGVSGVFGERALAKLADRVGRDGTSFKTALGRIELDAGTMHVRELELSAAGFDLGGSARVEMLAGTLDGQFVLRLSPAISAAMKADDSTAAKIFWNSAAKRVEIPFTLKGPFSKPKPGVDLGAAARNTIRDRAESELRELVESRLGGKKPTAPAGATPTPAVAEPVAPTAPPDPSQLGARIDAHRWRGSILARDLQLDGVIHGPSLATATLEVRDSRARTIRQRELVELGTYLGSAADPAAPVIVPWSLKIDGEKLLLAEFPVSVIVTVTDAAGTSATTTLSVDR